METMMDVTVSSRNTLSEGVTDTRRFDNGNDEVEIGINIKK